MAEPTVSITPDKTLPYAPGEMITLSWTAMDADNASETITYVGTDSQGNEVTGQIVINRQDPFVMTSVRWDRTGTAFAINNGSQTATSVVPGA